MKKYFAILAMILLPMSATAALIEFDLRGSGGNLGVADTTFSAGGVTLSVAGYAIQDSAATPTVRSNIHRNSRGLGLVRGANSIANDDGTDRWLAEFLTMSTDIGTIVALELNRLGAGEQALIGSVADVDASGAGVIDVVDGVSNARRWVNVDSTFDFAIAAITDFDSLSAFRLSGVRVEADVPESSTLALLALGLIGLAVARRKA